MNTLITRNTWRLLSAISTLLFALSAQAASFDCAKAGTKVEHIICDTPEISTLDDELSAAYKAALKDKRQAYAIRQAQKKWMKERNKCADAECVMGRYKERIFAFAQPTFTLVSGNKKEADVFISASMDMNMPGRHFKLVKGRNTKVCKVYLKNLEALKNLNLACERKVSAVYKGDLKFPDWRRLDLWENRNLWAQVEAVAAVGAASEYPLEGTLDAEEQLAIDKLAKKYKEHAEQYHEEIYKISVAEMDIDNDGKGETVLREASGVCGGNAKHHFIGLFVLNKEGNSVDVPKSIPLFQDSVFSSLDSTVQEAGIIGNGSMYDMFSYEGEGYFDRWSQTGIWIYKIVNGRTESVCHLN